MAPTPLSAAPRGGKQGSREGAKCVSFVDLANEPILAGEDDLVVEKAASILEEDKSARFPLGARYKVLRKLGKGAYGQVMSAYDTLAERHVAIKRSSLTQFERTADIKRLLREVAILCALSTQKHDNIVRLYALETTCEEDHSIRSVYLVLEQCDSDLRNMIKTDAVLQPAHINRITYTLLCGVEFLHLSGVLHRDLKPANVLVNDDCTAKICDFGLSRTLHETAEEEDEESQMQPNLTGHVVTRWYRAPELILLQRNYTQAIDVWSVGCIYAELIGMLEGVDPDERRPLFPGRACYPLSPDKRRAEEESRPSFLSDADQLEVIFDVIGTPEEHEVEELDHHKAREHVYAFDPREGRGIGTELPAADDCACDFLWRILRFSARTRSSATELLEHEVFETSKEDDRRPTPACKVVLPFEQLRLDRRGLDEYFREEIRNFKPESAGAKKHAASC